MRTGMNLDDRVRRAVRDFWRIRTRQGQVQGATTGRKDAGARSAVTGGAQMSGFVELIRDLVASTGIESAQVCCGQAIELPGWYRPEKKWDLLVLSHGQLVAAIEFKSHIGPSFGNNFNNRTEEALGSATDLWAAYREGAFRPSARPWLGYMMLLEDCERSTTPTRARMPQFPVFPEFEGASYQQRYELLLTNNDERTVV
ncbi:MAG: hypothetical protein IT163_15980 [Bryobacterales bacterium]|nr:hypothetical protein [Bryobacterales bacterium]